MKYFTLLGLSIFIALIIVTTLALCKAAGKDTRDDDIQ
jgi:hypothetical protein